MRMIFGDPKLGSDKEVLAGDEAKMDSFLESFTESLFRAISSSSVEVSVTLFHGLNDSLLSVFLACEVRGRSHSNHWHPLLGRGVWKHYCGDFNSSSHSNSQRVDKYSVVFQYLLMDITEGHPFLYCNISSCLAFEKSAIGGRWVILSSTHIHHLLFFILFNSKELTRKLGQMRSRWPIRYFWTILLVLIIFCRRHLKLSFKVELSCSR